jgi:hypothetical protein
MLAPLLMSSKHFIIRKFQKEYDPFSQTIDGFIIEYSFFTCLAVYLGFYGAPDLSLRNLIIGTIAGLLFSLARINMSMAIALGIAGPAQALISTHSLYQTMWSAVLDGQALTFWQLSGIAFGLLGVFVMTCIDTLIKRLKAPNP